MNTEKFGSSGKSFDLFSEISPVRISAENRLTWLRFFVVSLSSSVLNLGHYFELGRRLFPCPVRFSVHYRSRLYTELLIMSKVIWTGLYNYIKKTSGGDTRSVGQEIPSSSR